MYDLVLERVLVVWSDPVRSINGVRCDHVGRSHWSWRESHGRQAKEVCSNAMLTEVVPLFSLLSAPILCGTHYTGEKLGTLADARHPANHHALRGREHHLWGPNLSFHQLHMTNLLPNASGAYAYCNNRCQFAYRRSAPMQV
jgi:hypothetical protein